MQWIKSGNEVVAMNIRSRKKQKKAKITVKGCEGSELL